jgi:hypothetical protein
MPRLSPKLSKFERFLDSVKFDHFLSLADDTGMLQHSRFSIPDRRLGYTTDDNARALVVAARQYDLELSREWLMLTRRFLAFLIGMQEPDGRFHNFMSYAREVEGDLGPGDHLGRALWATSCVIDSLHLPAGIKASAKEIFDKALPSALASTSLRVKAHAIKGLSRYVSRFRGDSNARRNLSGLVQELSIAYRASCSCDWKWFEDILSYENWRLPECLFEAYLVGENCLAFAEESLRFLIGVEFKGGMLIPVGSQGWYRRNSVGAEFDQLPVEAGSAVEALAVAAQATGRSRYWDLALRALRWYHGKNRKRVTVYDAESGACHDGVSSTGLNLNRGAESTISYLLAVTRIRSMTMCRHRP